MECPRCQDQNPESKNFCGACGRPLRSVAGGGSYAELQAENEELKRSLGEAREQQTATAEVLRIISTSPTDLQPVLDAVVERAARLCVANDAVIFRDDGDTLTPVATCGVPAVSSVPRTRGTASGRAIVDRQPVHVEDLASPTSIAEFPDANVPRARGIRTQLAVPLLREGEAVGVILIRRFHVQPFTEQQIALLKTFADQAVIAIENVRLFTELQEKNRALSEALEQQTATSEILRVISKSPTDLQPVFDPLLDSAVRLCGATHASLYRADGDVLHHVAAQGSIRGPRPVGMTAPIPRGTAPGRAILTGETVQVMDSQEEVAGMPPDAREYVLREGVRTVLAVPLLREGVSIGVIVIRRTEVRPFSETEVRLLQTFADQAVIAIENVRLFKELEERNRDLTATSEILRVIASSPTDLQPVFDTIAERSMRLCEATFGWVLMFDGELIHLRSLANVSPEGAEALQRMFPVAPSRASFAGRTILTGAVVHVPDVLDDPEYEFKETARAVSVRSVVTVPLLHQGRSLGVIAVSRPEPGAFSAEQVQLLKTFADQAVIAIENVRLFTELQTSNSDLTKALDTQTATSDILRVISRSQTDVQPVFDTILTSAVQLLRGHSGALTRLAGDQIELAAHTSVDDAGDASLRAIFPQSLHSELPHAQAIPQRAPINIADTQSDPGIPEPVRASARARGYHSWVTVPMLRQDEAVGTIAVTRSEAGGFTDEEIALLQTFADQAVIAIENVRLFTELQEKNKALTQAHAQMSEALEQQKATSEILSVISSSPTDVRPVFDTIAQSAARLCEAFDASIFERDRDQLRLVAHHGPIPIQPVLPLIRGTSNGRAILDRRTVHTADMQRETEEFPEGSENARLMGHRTILSVPLLEREGLAIGTINIRRMEARPFTERQVALLQTFAAQAVIAIENVRLFKELEARNRDLTATGEILQVISRSPTDAQPVFDTIADNAVRLFRPWSVAVYRFDGEFMHVGAVRGGLPGSEQYLREQGGRRPTRDVMAGRCIIDRSVIHVPDFETDPNVPVAAREIARVRGFRATINVPMVRGGEPIGVISVSRAETGPFSQAEIDLLQTFADQAVIAIENVRLFKELAARNQDLTGALDQQTATSKILTVISSSPTEVQPVFDAIAESSVRLCGALFGGVYRLDGELVRLVAHYNYPPDALEYSAELFPAPLDRRLFATQAIRERGVVNVPDVPAVEGAYPWAGHVARDFGFRSVLVVPMFRGGEPIGAIQVWHPDVAPFSDTHIGLLKTFADQAVIAIENVRLFKELEAANRELAAASQHKSEFLANMSHELRTPLNAIIGFSEVLSEKMFGELNEKQDEYLKDIHASGQHLLSLINDILDLSKIEAGRMELELSDFDLPMTIDNALMLIRERAVRRSIALHTTVDERLGQIQADERKIRQVLLNLLSNAIKFTPEGGRIHVEARAVNESIEVSVTDTGVGIAPEDQEAVFEEFRQVGTADKKVEGTGLGLALSRKFIELHGGKIWVESQVGEGSTFTFTIPVRRGE